MSKFGTSVIAERDSAFGNDGVQFGEAFEVLVDDRLVDMGPEGFGRLTLGGVGCQVNEVYALGHGERRGVPAGAVEWIMIRSCRHRLRGQRAPG